MERLPLDARKKIAEFLTYDEIMDLCASPESPKNVCNDPYFFGDRTLLNFPGAKLSRVLPDKMEAKYLYLSADTMDSDLNIMAGKPNEGDFKEKNDNWRAQEQFEKKRQIDSDDYKKLQKRWGALGIALKDWDRWFKREYYKISSKMLRYLHKVRELWPSGESKKTRKIN
jgi:hypothetical protein